MVGHINIVGILFVAGGGMQLMMALLIGFIFFTLGGGLALLGGSTGEGEMIVVGGLYAVIGIFVGVVSGVMSMPSMVAGYGLYKRKGWARIVALVVGALAMMNFPMGTLLGVYAFVTLLDRDVADEFAAAS